MTTNTLENIRLKSHTFPMEKSQNYLVAIFLTVITFGFYLPNYYEIWTAKINIIAKGAFGGEVEKLEFRPELLSIPLIVIYGMVAILVLDIGFSGAIAPNIFEAVIFCALGVAIISLILFIGYSVRAINKTAHALKTIAREYELADVVVLLQFSKFLWRESNCFHAFNEIADEYNRRKGRYSIR
jgi:hypothetical protein